jgi:hypothetical protein
MEIIRPKTRGELANLLKTGNQCEIVSDNVQITLILLKAWLGVDNVKVSPSTNCGWTILKINP